MVIKHCLSLTDHIEHLIFAGNTFKMFYKAMQNILLSERPDYDQRTGDTQGSFQHDLHSKMSLNANSLLPSILHLLSMKALML